MRKVLPVFIVFLLLLMSVPKAEAATDDITDHFFETEMRYLISKEVLQGDGAGHYRPDAAVTRAEFAALMVRGLGLQSVSPAEFSVAETAVPLFQDVDPNDWFYSAIDSAVKAGIVFGYPDNTFQPYNLISRQEMAVMAFRAIEAKGIQSDPSDLTFADKDAIHSYALDAIQRLVNLGIMNGNGDNTFAPLANTTRGQTSAVITRILKTIDPSIDLGYNVVEFIQDGKTKSVKYYNDFNDAKNYVGNNQAVMQGNTYVYIKSGGVVSNSLTSIYDDTDFIGSGRTYVTMGTELQYLDAGPGWVKIKIANEEGFVKPENVNLIPAPLVKNQSFYFRVGDELNYRIYNPLTDKLSGEVMVGKAPSFMAEGQNYYSWDGIAFTNSAGQEVGRAYQYFNVLPARTVSNYSAEELNRYIDAKLDEREKLYVSNPTTFARYQDATTVSKIKGLGDYIKEAESKYKINALIILAMAIHESDYGMSQKAKDLNNLFGIKVFDTDPDAAERYAAPNDSIDALATQYLNLNYIPPTGGYANGAVLGNKALGFNMKYASDPYWGQKIAGHMYRADKYLGNKDFGKYRIGITNVKDLNVRHEPMVSGTNLQFTYEDAGMPVAILDSPQTNGVVWHKVVSDHNNYTEGYIRADYVTEINVAK